jgi:hypothetical protein
MARHTTAARMYRCGLPVSVGGWCVGRAWANHPRTGFHQRRLPLDRRQHPPRLSAVREWTARDVPAPRLLQGIVGSVEVPEAMARRQCPVPCAGLPRGRVPAPPVTVGLRATKLLWTLASCSACSAACLRAAGACVWCVCVQVRCGLLSGCPRWPLTPTFVVDTGVTGHIGVQCRLPMFSTPHTLLSVLFLSAVHPFWTLPIT